MELNCCCCFFCFFFSQVLCSAQVAPAEVSGHQEGDKKRSDGGIGERSIHESGQTQVGSCKLSLLVFFFLFCFVFLVSLKSWVDLSHSSLSSPPLFFSFILPFVLCMLDRQAPFTEVLALWPFEKESPFYCRFFECACVCVCGCVCALHVCKCVWPRLDPILYAWAPDQRRRPAVRSRLCCRVWHGWRSEWQLTYTPLTIA